MTVIDLTDGTSPIKSGDVTEIDRVKEWLCQFREDSELWRVAWRLVRTAQQQIKNQSARNALMDACKLYRHAAQEHTCSFDRSSSLGTQCPCCVRNRRLSQQADDLLHQAGVEL